MCEPLDLLLKKMSNRLANKQNQIMFPTKMESPSDGGTIYCVINNTNVSDIEECAKGYSQYDIGMAVNLYLLPAIFTIGVTGNVLTLIVMTLPKNRRVPCCIYWAALSVSDTMMLYVGLHIWAIIVFGRAATHAECRYIVYMYQIFQVYGTTLIMILTVDRMLAVRRPFLYLAMYTTHRARILTVGSFIVVVIYSLPHLVFAASVGRSTCAGLGKNSSTVAMVYAFVVIMLNGVIPFTVLFVLIFMIIHALRNRPKILRQCCSNLNHRTTVGKNPGSTSNSQHTPAKARVALSKSSLGKQLTMMLLLVTFMMLILTIPQYVRYLVFTIIDYSDDPQTFAWYILLYHISQKLCLTNNAINIFLHCISGPGFRGDVYTILTCPYNVIKEKLQQSTPTCTTHHPDIQQRCDTVADSNANNHCDFIYNVGRKSSVTRYTYM